MTHSMTGLRQLDVVAAMLTLVTLPTSLPACAGTPYEAQLGGRVYAVLTTLIIGEFGGRTSANTDATLNKRTCQPSDYDNLRKATKDNTTLITFRRRCDLVGTKVDDTHVHSIAHLPADTVRR